MPYPSFPAGGGATRPLWFSTFDPSYMSQAYQVLYNLTGDKAGGSPIYSPNEADPPSQWCPRYAMSGQTLRAMTSPVWWAQRVGMNRAALVSYAGGQTPS